MIKKLLFLGGYIFCLSVSSAYGMIEMQEKQLNVYATFTDWTIPKNCFAGPSNELYMKFTKNTKDVFQEDLHKNGVKLFYLHDDLQTANLAYQKTNLNETENLEKAFGSLRSHNEELSKQLQSIIPKIEIENNSNYIFLPKLSNEQKLLGYENYAKLLCKNGIQSAIQKINEENNDTKQIVITIDELYEKFGRYFAMNDNDSEVKQQAFRDGREQNLIIEILRDLIKKKHLEKKQLHLIYRTLPTKRGEGSSYMPHPQSQYSLINFAREQNKLGEVSTNNRDDLVNLNQLLFKRGPLFSAFNRKNDLQCKQVWKLYCGLLKQLAEEQEIKTTVFTQCQTAAEEYLKGKEFFSWYSFKQFFVPYFIYKIKTNWFKLSQWRTGKCSFAEYWFDGHTIKDLKNKKSA